MVVMGNNRYLLLYGNLEIRSQGNPPPGDNTKHTGKNHMTVKNFSKFQDNHTGTMKE